MGVVMVVGVVEVGCCGSGYGGAVVVVVMVGLVVVVVVVEVVLRDVAGGCGVEGGGGGINRCGYRCTPVCRIQNGCCHSTVSTA